MRSNSSKDIPLTILTIQKSLQRIKGKPLPKEKKELPPEVFKGVRVLVLPEPSSEPSPSLEHSCGSGVAHASLPRPLERNRKEKPQPTTVYLTPVSTNNRATMKVVARQLRESHGRRRGQHGGRQVQKGTAGGRERQRKKEKERNRTREREM